MVAKSQLPGNKESSSRESITDPGEQRRIEPFPEIVSNRILLANVFSSIAMRQNPPALHAAPFTKGGFWVPSFGKGGTGRISPTASNGGVKRVRQRFALG